MLATALMNFGPVLFPHIFQDYERIHPAYDFGVSYKLALDHLQLQLWRGTLLKLLHGLQEFLTKTRCQHLW